MKRRDLLKYTLFGAAFGGGLPLLTRPTHAAAPGFPPVTRRTLVHVTLNGGPDMRYLLPPAFDSNSSSYGYQYWQAMASAHGLDDTPSAWEARWNNDYLPATGGAFDFGILRDCGWLVQMWDAGKLAIVCNAFGATTRDHPHGLVAMHRGDHLAERMDATRSGWGGRLAAALDANVLALNRIPLQFAFGETSPITQLPDNERLIAVSDTRALSLFNTPSEGRQEWLERSLRNYYAGKRQAMLEDSVYRRFIDLEQKLREFGEPIDQRLAGIPVPAAIEALYAEPAPTMFDYAFGQQMRNVHDSFACNDILNPRVMSLEYQGFDTHDQQRQELEPRLVDMFGTGMAFDSLLGALPQDVRDNTVFMLSGEFGRQIRGNGDGGCDHGEGNIVLMFGEGVRGGIYGDMFPGAELTQLQDASPQILGQTSFERIFGAACEWIQPGSAETVFPFLEEAPLEAGFDPQVLFT